MNTANTKPHRFNLELWIVVVLFIYSCSQNTDRINQHSSVFEIINTIEVDKLRKVNAFYRNSDLIVIRIFINDSCEYVQFLLKRMDENVLKFKYKDKWINIDSIVHYFPLNTVGISKENIIYTSKLMEEFYFDEISTSCDSKGLRIKKDNITYYYLFDRTLTEVYNTDPTLRKLDGSWWVNKYSDERSTK